LRKVQGRGFRKRFRRGLEKRVYKRGLEGVYKKVKMLIFSRLNTLLNPFYF